MNSKKNSCCGNYMRKYGMFSSQQHTVYKETKWFKIVVFELQRTIWKDCFAFLWFFFNNGQLFFLNLFMLNMKSCQYPLINYLTNFKVFSENDKENKMQMYSDIEQRTGSSSDGILDEENFDLNFFQQRYKNIRFQVFWKAHVNLTTSGPNLTPEYFRNISIISTSLLAVAPYKFSHFLQT